MGGAVTKGSTCVLGNITSDCLHSERSVVRLGELCTVRHSGSSLPSAVIKRGAAPLKLRLPQCTIATTEKPGKRSMFCAQCGHRLADSMRFCPQCGTRAVVPASVAPLPDFEAHPASGVSAAVRRLAVRVRDILLAPSAEWPVIAAEPSTQAAIYGGYVAPLAALGVVASLLGRTLVGSNAPVLDHVRAGFAGDVSAALIAYLLSFADVFAVAWLVDALAPAFGGQRDRIRALKLAAYSFTPAWVAGVLQLVPALAMLALLAGCYGLYLLYVGLPVLMRCPKQRSLGYSIVLGVCAVLVSAAIMVLSTSAATVLGSAAEGTAGGHGASTSTALSPSQKFGEDAQRAMVRTASETRASADLLAALNAIGAIVPGGKDVHPVDFRKLRDMLPETLSGMKRVDATGQSGEAMGIKGSSATARYTNDAGASLNLEISDLGSLAGLAGLASRLEPPVEKETDAGYERTRKINGQIVHERYDRQAKNGE